MWAEVQRRSVKAWGRLQEIWDRKHLAYRSMFFERENQLSVAGEIVLKDLAKFCRAFESTAMFSPVTGQLDPIASAKADGRREVYLRFLKIMRENNPSSALSALAFEAE